MVTKLVGSEQVLLTPDENDLSDAQIAAQAQATVTKDAAHYQNTPHGDAQCSLCSMFVRGFEDDAGGFCSKVHSFRGPQGWIYRDGWCRFFELDKDIADLDDLDDLDDVMLDNEGDGG